MKKQTFATLICLLLCLIGVSAVCAQEGLSADQKLFNLEYNDFLYYVDGYTRCLQRENTTTGKSEQLLDEYVVSIEFTDSILYVTTMNTTDGSFNIKYCDVSNNIIFSSINDENNNIELFSAEDELLGTLSEIYESNGNPSTISSGKGDAGGVSYGAYQFSSVNGVPKAFADWCSLTDQYAEYGNRLNTAYAKDNNSYGNNFNAEWKALASENKQEFFNAQHDYTKKKYYDVAVVLWENAIDGFYVDNYSIALKNVIWSRAVQHSPSGSKNVFVRAVNSLGGFSNQSEPVLIEAIYSESGAVIDSGTNAMEGNVAKSYGIAGKYMKYYSSSSSDVQISVYIRLNYNEKNDALEMYYNYGGIINIVSSANDYGWFDASEPLTLSWNSLADATNYRYSVASMKHNADGTGNEADGQYDNNGTYNSMFKVAVEGNANNLIFPAGTFAPDSAYKIWVGGYSGYTLEDELPGSSYIYVFTNPSSATVTPPRITSPANGYVNADPGYVYISWTSVAEATSYTVDVKEYATNRHVISRTEYNAHCEINADSDGILYLADNTKYKITITAHTASGDVTSADSTFTTTNKPYITYPTQGQMIESSSMTVEWNGSTGSTDYRILLKDGNGNVVPGYNEVSTNGKEYYSITGLENGKTYTIGIYAVVNGKQVWQTQGVTFYVVYDTAITSVGDVNGDGEIDFMDAHKILCYDAGTDSILPENITSADVTGDGIIDFMDAYKILKYDAGLIDRLN